MKRFMCFVLMLLLVFSACTETLYFSAAPSSDTRACILYYPLVDESGLGRAEITVSARTNLSFPETLMRLLLQTPLDPTLGPAAGKGARLTLVEDTGDVITVGMEMPARTNERMKALCAFSIWRTLMENTAALGVNVLFNGCCPVYERETLNTFGRITAEELSFQALVKNAKETRNCTVYRPETSGRYLIPVLSSCAAGEKDVRHLISHLFDQDDGNGLMCVWPSDYAPGKVLTFRCGYDGAAKRMLTVDYNDSDSYSYSFADAFAQTGMQKWQFLASLSLTLITNLPDVQRVRFCYNGIAVSEFTGPDGSGMTLEDGAMSRESFSAWIAAKLSCTAVGEDGSLVSSSSVIPVSDASDAAAVLLRCLPDALKPGDILNASVIGKTAYIDLTASFYSACQALDAPGEHALVYRMVNALCDNTQAEKVYITVSGMMGQTFAGHVRIDNALWPDHGLVPVS